MRTAGRLSARDSDRIVTEASEESFPASDAPSHTPTLGSLATGRWPTRIVGPQRSDRGALWADDQAGRWHLLYCGLVSAPPTTGPSAEDRNPAGIYVLVVVVEALVISVLYWLGRHFS